MEELPRVQVGAMGEKTGSSANDLTPPGSRMKTIITTAEADLDSDNWKTCSLYELLGICTDATPQNIRQAYLKKAKEWHPDKITDNAITSSEKDTVTERFQRLHHAYHTLIEPTFRRDYDWKNNYRDTTSTQVCQCYFETEPESSQNNIVVSEIITQVNTCSVTVIVQLGTANIWKEFIEAHYNARFKELMPGDITRGLFLKTVHVTNEGDSLGTVAITLYPQKHKMLIQGSSYQLWIDETMPKIASKVKPQIMSHPNSEQPSNLKRNPRPIREKRKTRQSIVTSTAKGQCCSFCSSYLSEDDEIYCCAYCPDAYHLDCHTNMPLPPCEYEDGGLVNMCRKCAMRIVQHTKGSPNLLNTDSSGDSKMSSSETEDFEQQNTCMAAKIAGTAPTDNREIDSGVGALESCTEKNDVTAESKKMNTLESVRPNESVDIPKLSDGTEIDPGNSASKPCNNAIMNGDKIGQFNTKACESVKENESIENSNSLNDNKIGQLNTKAYESVKENESIGNSDSLNENNMNKKDKKSEIEIQEDIHSSDINYDSETQSESGDGKQTKSTKSKSAYCKKRISTRKPKTSRVGNSVDSRILLLQRRVVDMEKSISQTPKCICNSLVNQLRDFQQGILEVLKPPDVSGESADALITAKENLKKKTQDVTTLNNKLSEKNKKIQELNDKVKQLEIENGSLISRLRATEDNKSSMEVNVSAKLQNIETILTSGKCSEIITNPGGKQDNNTPVSGEDFCKESSGPEGENNVEQTVTDKVEVLDQHQTNRTYDEPGTSKHQRSPKTKYNVPTENKFSVLSDVNESGNAVEQLARKQTVQQNVFVIADSHGRNIRPERMYSKKISASVKTLRHKTINDASEYVDKINIQSQVLAYVIGSNDLTHKSAEDAAESCKKLVQKSIRLFKNTEIVLYEVPPRKSPIIWRGYEERRKRFNQIMEHYCSVTKKLHWAPCSISCDQIQDDQVHLKPGEERTLVSDLKAIINPLVGLKSYKQYNNSNLNTSTETETPQSIEVIARGSGTNSIRYKMPHLQPNNRHERMGQTTGYQYNSDSVYRRKPYHREDMSNFNHQVENQNTHSAAYEPNNTNNEHGSNATPSMVQPMHLTHTNGSNATHSMVQLTYPPRTNGSNATYSMVQPMHPPHTNGTHSMVQPMYPPHTTKLYNDNMHHYQAAQALNFLAKIIGMA